MANDPPIVEAHSVAEAYLYAKVTACPRCRRGMLTPIEDLTHDDSAWRLPCECQRCRKSITLRFRIDPQPSRASAQSKVINPTDQPSRAIDLLGWLNLFQQIVTAAGRANDRVAGRELAIEAAACLDEALKFYDENNEMPPPAAFFTDVGKAALRDHPQKFARSKWIDRRMTLPKADTVTRGTAESRPRRRRWWPFGRDNSS